MGPLGQQWHATAETVLTGMEEWRTQHPRATFAEIEAALDERLAGLRARRREDLAAASRARTVAGAAGDERVACPRCGGRLVRQGTHTRTRTTHRDTPVRLARDYAQCSACGAGLSPLDEDLGLLPGALSPTLHADLVRLGTWLPFGRAVQEVSHVTQVVVSETTAARLTEAAGAAYVAVQAAEVARVEQAPEAGPGGPAGQQTAIQTALGYLGTRLPPMRYAAFQAQGYPIGSGAGPRPPRPPGRYRPGASGAADAAGPGPWPRFAAAKRTHPLAA